MSLWPSFLTVALKRKPGQRALQRAIEAWHSQHALLSERFLFAASATGKPRGMAWTRSEILDPVVFAWEPESRELLALTTVEIQWEPFRGGEMEDLMAARIPRHATGLFFFDGQKWQTRGRALFNMGPRDAVQRLAGPLELCKPPA